MWQRRVFPIANCQLQHIKQWIKLLESLEGFIFLVVFSKYILCSEKMHGSFHDLTLQEKQNHFKICKVPRLKKSPCPFCVEGQVNGITAEKTAVVQGTLKQIAKVNHHSTFFSRH